MSSVAPMSPPPQPSASMRVVMAVSSDLAGAVIGKKGTTLTHIRHISHCKIIMETMETSDRERIITILGSSYEGVDSAVDGILTALFDSGKHVAKVTMLFHPKIRGPLIGKGGSTISDIRASSTATVTVYSDGIRVLSEFCRCDIQGEPEAMRSASRQVGRILCEFSSSEPSEDSAVHRNGNLGGVSSYGAIGSAMNASTSPSRVTMEMTVPKRFIGNIIGRNGKYVNAVRQQFNVEVKVDDSRDLVYSATNDAAAILSVTGPREHVWLACGKCVKNLLFGAEDGAPMHSETFTMPARAVPRIIGKAGSHISTIRSSSRATITINQPKQSDDEDLHDAGALATIMIEGSEREVIGARMMIESTERSPPPQAGSYRMDAGMSSMSVGMQMPFAPGMPIPGRAGVPLGGGPMGMVMGPGMGSTITLDMYVPKQLTGLIIGRSGKSINNVRAATKTEIKVSDGVGFTDQATGDELANLSIQSHDSATAWIAASQLMTFLHSAKYNSAGPNDDTERRVVLQVPKDELGVVIGKAGSKIAMIRESSACKITIQQDDSSEDADIVLEGKPRQIVAARCLIRTRETRLKPNGENQVTQVHATSTQKQLHELAYTQPQQEPEASFIFNNRVVGHRG